MQSLTAFLLAPILALAVATAPVSQEKSSPEKKRSCGTVISPEQLKAELTRQTELTRKSSAALAVAPPTDAPYHLPMTIHKVLPSDGSWDPLPLYRLDGVMQELNRRWAQVGIQFFIYGEIDHIYDDTYFNPCTATPNLTSSGRSMLSRTRSTFTSPICMGYAAWQALRTLKFREWCWITIAWCT